MQKPWHENGEKVVLVRLETSPEDIEGMQVAEGILTVRGGMTSHAAVVARGMGTCCVSGCGDITVDYENKQFTLGGKVYKEGDYISIDGSTGNIYGEAIPPLLLPFPATLAASWAGRINSVSCRYSPMQILLVTPLRLSPSAQKASASAVLSICSSRATVLRLSAK